MLLKNIIEAGKRQAKRQQEITCLIYDGQTLPFVVPAS